MKIVLISGGVVLLLPLIYFAVFAARLGFLRATKRFQEHNETTNQ